MPIYEYECTSCGKLHEIIQKFNDEPLASCPACGGPVKKLISNTSFVLKGSGWYATDYAGDKKKTKAEGASKEKAAESTSEPKPVTKAGKAAEAKTAASQ